MIGTGLAYQAPPMLDAMHMAADHWDAVRLKNVASLNRLALPDSTDPDVTIAYVDIGSVDRDGRLGEPVYLPFGEAPSRARRLVKCGDTIVSTVRTYLRAIAYIETHSADVVVSTGFTTLSPLSSIEPRFLFWWLRSLPFVEEIVARSFGVSYPAVNASDIGDVAIALPPRPEQEAIARFLDAEMLPISNLIAEQELLVAKLGERLTQARRLLVLGSDGSGQADWGHGPLKRFIRIARGRFMHRPRNDPALYDGPYPFIQTGDIARAVDGVVNSYSQTLNEAGLETSRMAKAGTLVMAIAANIGDVARLDFDCCFPDSVVALTPGPLLLPEYLLELIRALKPELVGNSTLNTQLNINVERIGEVRVPIPPLPNQLELVRQLDLMRDHLSKVTSETDTQMALLREHRDALITTTVTRGLGAIRGTA